MTAESEALTLGATLIKALEPLWKPVFICAGALCTPVLWWKRHVDKSISRLDKELSVQRLYVEQNHPSNDDFKEMKTDVRAIRETMDDLLLAIGGKPR